MAKLIITGATGAAGSEILRVALADAAVSAVTVLSRRPLLASTPASDKLHLIIHKDFETYPPELMEQLSSYDACIWALGITSRGMQEGAYSKITHDYPVAMMKGLIEARQRASDISQQSFKPFQFLYVSGNGADTSEKSRILFARVKGRAENSLAALSTSSAIGITTINFRPGYFFPNDPNDRKEIRSSAGAVADVIFRPLLRVLNPLIPGAYVPIRGIAGVAAELAKGRSAGDNITGNNIINSGKIGALCKEWDVLRGQA